MNNRAKGPEIFARDHAGTHGIPHVMKTPLALWQRWRTLRDK
jgi:hypothetical protein